MTNTHYAEEYAPQSFINLAAERMVKRLPITPTGWSRVIDGSGNVAIDFLPSLHVARVLAAQLSLDPSTPGGRNVLQLAL